MPAAIAFLMVPARAPVFGSVTAMPSTFLSIAAWISWACLVASGSFEYCSSTLSLAAAASAPLRMMSQKVSPGAWWVIMATVILGVFATPAPPPELDWVACRPPDDEQAASPAAAAARATARPRTRGFLNMGTPRRRGDAPGRGTEGRRGSAGLTERQNSGSVSLHRPAVPRPPGEEDRIVTALTP